MSDYFNIRKYTGRGVTIELEPDSDKRPKWSVRIHPSPLWWTEFKSKFDAILFASRKQKRSMESMHWKPEETPQESAHDLRPK